MSSGCVSGFILATRKNEGTIFNYQDPTKAHIEKHLGRPVAMERFDPPITINDVREANEQHPYETPKYQPDPISGRSAARTYSELFINWRYNPVVNSDLPADTPIVECVTYKYKGRLIPAGMIGDRFFMACSTFFLTEAVNIPLSLATVLTGWNTINVFKVWYDKSGRAWAYTWEPPDKK